MASFKRLHDSFDAYKKWVMNNPTHATEMENVTKWLSYLIAGKVNKSAAFSEMVYSLSNLFTLYNDMLIRKVHSGVDIYKPSFKDRLKLFLTILHYSEVLLEISFRNKWGDKGKWSTATVVQILRCISNLILIYRYSEIPLLQPPIPVLQRKNISNDYLSEEYREEGFVLKRSGRVIRRVEASLPVSLRNWKPLLVTIQQEVLTSKDVQNDKMNSIKVVETLYAIKPLVHLGSIAYFGSEAWKQWLISLLFDLHNIRFHIKEKPNYNYEQRLEISRRKFSLLLYILKSPMYQKYSSSVINNILNGLTNNVPLVGLICKPILQHLPDWQDMYFYMWPY